MFISRLEESWFRRNIVGHGRGVPRLKTRTRPRATVRGYVDLKSSQVKVERGRRLQGFVRFRHHFHVVIHHRVVAASRLLGFGLGQGTLTLAAVGEKSRTHVELNKRTEDDQQTAEVFDRAAGVDADLEDRLEPAGLAPGLGILFPERSLPGRRCSRDARAARSWKSCGAGS